MRGTDSASLLLPVNHHQTISHRSIRRKRGWIDSGIRCMRIRRESDDHHFGFRIDIHGLTVYTPCSEGAVIIVGDPPLIMVAPSR